MTEEVDYDELDSICSFKSKKYSKSSEKNKHGQRIYFLLKSAEFFSVSNPSLSRWYIKELIEICEKHLIRLKPNVKRKFCKGCYSYLVDGINSFSRNPRDSIESRSKSGVKGPESARNSLVSVICLVCSRSRKHNPVT